MRVGGRSPTHPRPKGWRVLCEAGTGAVNRTTCATIEAGCVAGCTDSRSGCLPPACGRPRGRPEPSSPGRERALWGWAALRSRPWTTRARPGRIPRPSPRQQGWNFEILAGGVASNRNDLVGTIDSLTNLPFDDIVSGDRLDLLPELIGDIRNLLGRGHERALLGRRGDRRHLQGLRAVGRRPALRRDLPGHRPGAHGAGRRTGQRPRPERDRPLPRGTLGARGPAGVRARVPGRRPLGRRRGAGGLRPHVLRALRRLRQLPEQEHLRDRQAGVREQRGRRHRVHVRRRARWPISGS